MTDAVAENVDYSDPAVRPDVQMQQRDCQPRGEVVVNVMSVSQIYDTDDGGVA